MSRVRQIVTNATAGSLAVFLRAGIAFLMMPFLLKHLGQSSFGLMGLLGVVVGFSQLADLGLRGALGRELTESKTRGDRVAYGELATTAFVVYLCVASACCAALVAFSGPILVLLKIPDALLANADALILHYVIPSVIISFVTPVFAAGLASINRFDLIHAIRIYCTLTAALALLVVLPAAQDKLEAWAIISIGEQVCVLALSVLVAFRQVSELRLSPRRFRASRLVPLLGLGGYLYTLQVTQALSQYSDPLVVSAFFGPAGVALYQPGSRLSQVARPVVTTLANQLYPITTLEHVRGDLVPMQRILVLGTKFTLYLGVLATVVSVAIAFPLCRLWLGDVLGAQYTVAAWVLVAWSFADFMTYAAGVQYPVLLGMRCLGFLMWTQLPLSVANLFLSIYFVGYTSLGIPGVLIATVAIGMIRRPILIWYTAKKCQLKPVDYLRLAYLRPMAMLSVLAIGSGVVRLSWALDSWLELCLFAISVCAVWAALLWFIALERSEKSILMSAIGRRTRQ